MSAHSQRAHAKWAASASARNAVCAGAIAMCSMVEAKESEAAAWGTAVHEMSDACLKNPALEPESFKGQTKAVGRFSFEVDDEMVDCVSGYVDRCVEAIAAEPCLFFVEENLPLDKLQLPMEAGGTGDLVIYQPRLKKLIIRDLKTGRGVFVDAKGSWQMRTYALGALLAHPTLDVEMVEVIIDQPRFTRDGDNGVRGETFHVADLYDWAAMQMAPAVEAAAQADREFQEIAGNRVKFDAWAEKWLRTGQCTFCDAKALCPKIRAEALGSMPAKAAQWFETPTDERAPEMSNAAMLLSIDELAHALNGLEMVEAWAKSVREYAHYQAESGKEIPGWILVEKVGNRAWIDAAQALIVMRQMLIPDEKLLIYKLISPAQADKLLGKRKTEIADLWERPKRGLNLVQAGSTSRPAVQTKAQQNFEAPE